MRPLPRTSLVAVALALLPFACDSSSPNPGVDTVDAGGLDSALPDSSEAADAPPLEGDAGPGCGPSEVPPPDLVVTAKLIAQGWQFAGTTTGDVFTAEPSACERKKGFIIHPVTGVAPSSATEKDFEAAACAIAHGSLLPVDNLGLNDPSNECGGTPVVCDPISVVQLLWDAKNERGYIYQVFPSAPRKLIGQARFAGKNLVWGMQGAASPTYAPGGTNFSCTTP